MDLSQRHALDNLRPAARRRRRSRKEMGGRHVVSKTTGTTGLPQKSKPQILSQALQMGKQIRPPEEGRPKTLTLSLSLFPDAKSVVAPGSSSLDKHRTPLAPCCRPIRSCSPSSARLRSGGRLTARLSYISMDSRARRSGGRPLASLAMPRARGP